ncbi:MAG: hypothetical protein VR72_14925 [Clostridiaceae bacterium BRH_c20a]|nr:MAG: hypothetical protein VR72_14925 [Clostridiaceae bacterium BRH_c20a]
MKNNKFLLIVCISFLMATVLTFGIRQDSSIAENGSNFVNKIQINKSGKVAKDNLDNIIKINAGLLKKTPGLTIVATINDTVDLSAEEFDYMKKMYVAYDMNKSDNYIFNVLLEEKIKLAEVQKKGLIPTEKEITDYILMEQKIAGENPEVLREIINSSGLTEDDYWNIFERFYATKIVAFSKLSQSIFKDAGIENTDKVGLELLETQKEYYKKFIGELKDKATVTINKEYKDFSYDKKILTVK